ncbi:MULTISPECIES: aldose-1-epimerase [unclassified Schaalia]|uniref:aldose-1-epimerase n=1 Tax=unclassified Schaalia TaxID=2691889 RepID=UPI001E56C51E|nr:MULTISPECIES: aldose-1-epimerase [unclassified Schaalia]MCD4549662.1 aldose-1-epimerase [Schaalia sp. lx-260]MCD4556725.1 aldose-1-epimerase [Schaalia sp. lx-100]
MTPAASGTEVTLTSGEYTARIVSVGAGIAGLTLNGKDLVHPHSVDEVPLGYLGKTLVPWPNRIAGGSYTWKNTRYDVPINEPTTGCALHGLMAWTDWHIIHSDHDSTTLGAFIAPRYEYPWTLQCWVTYALHADTGLSVSITTKNTGKETAPYGVSSHPYLTIGLTPADEYVLSIPATHVAQTDDNLIPVGLCAAKQLDLDYRTPRLVSTQSIDHAFTGLPNEKWAVRLALPEKDEWVEIEAATPWVQVYSAEKLGRRSIAVEPMTCPPNAFNSGIDVIELQPGESHTLSFSIRGHIH